MDEHRVRVLIVIWAISYVVLLGIIGVMGSGQCS